MGRALLCLAATLGTARANGRHDAKGHVIEGLAPEELAVSDSGKLGDRPPSYDLWSQGDRQGPAPYPYPKDRKYITKGGPKEGMINARRPRGRSTAAERRERERLAATPVRWTCS